MNGTTILTIVAVILLIVVLSPLFTIWALNTLFGLNIPTNFTTWFATLWLTAIFAAKVSATKSN